MRDAILSFIALGIVVSIPLTIGVGLFFTRARA